MHESAYDNNKIIEIQNEKICDLENRNFEFESRISEQCSKIEELEIMISETRALNCDLMSRWNNESFVEYQKVDLGNQAPESKIQG